MTKAEMIEGIAALLATAGILDLDKIVWLANMRHLKHADVEQIFTETLATFQKTLFIGNAIHHSDAGAGQAG